MWEKVWPDYREWEKYSTGDFGTAGREPGTGILKPVHTKMLIGAYTERNQRYQEKPLDTLWTAFRPHSFR